METASIFGLLLCGVLFLESAFTVFTEDRSLSFSATIRHLRSHPKSLRSQDVFWMSLIGLLVCGAPWCIPLLSLSSTRLTVDVSQMQASVIEPVGLSHKTVETYENEDFGSKINDLLLRYTFYSSHADDRSADNDIYGALTLDDVTGEKSWFAAAYQGKDRILYRSPSERFNQFEGTYTVAVALRGERLPLPAGVPVGEVIVRNSLQGAVLSRLSLTSDMMRSDAYQLYELSYDMALHGPAPVIEIMTFGRLGLWYRYARVTPDNVEMQTNKVEDLYPDILDNDASEGYARFATPARHLPGMLSFGPYDSSVSPGQYLALYRIKISEQASDVGSLLRLQTAALRDRSSAQRLRTIEVDKALLSSRGELGSYVTLGVPIDIGPDDRIEFRTYWYGTTPVWFDSVRLVKRGGPNDMFIITPDDTVVYPNTL